MLGSLGEMSYGRLRSNTKNFSVVGSDVYRDFGNEKMEQRRSSFLPYELSVELAGSKVSEVTYYGSTFMTSLGRQEAKVLTTFITGSKYIGQWNMLGIAGKGIYKYPHGVIYDGHFNKNGEFHGSGILIYTNGQRLEGIWKNGKLLPGANFVTRDNALYNEDYCRMPDRRFQIEVETELQPANREYLAHAPKPIKIPTGCYDAGDGFYDPKLKVVRNYENIDFFKPVGDFGVWANEERRKNYCLLLRQSPSDRNILYYLKRWKTITKNIIESIPMTPREEWIKRNCRKAWNETTGYRPELYEIWTTGAKKYEVQKIIEYDYSKRVTGPIELDEELRLSQYSECLNSIIPGLGSLSESRQSRATLGSLQTLSSMFVKPLGTELRIRMFKKRYYHNRHSSTGQKQGGIRLSKRRYKSIKPLLSKL